MSLFLCLEHLEKVFLGGGGGGGGSEKICKGEMTI